MPCPWLATDCRASALCPGCLAEHLAVARPQARIAGAVYAERHNIGAISQDVALGLVRALMADDKAHDELAREAMAGAAAWYESRPERYR